MGPQSDDRRSFDSSEDVFPPRNDWYFDQDVDSVGQDGHNVYPVPGSEALFSNRPLAELRCRGYFKALASSEGRPRKMAPLGGRSM